MIEALKSRPGDEQSIDPMVDCVFKAILGSQDHENVTKHFLNAVLELEGADRIEKIYIENPFSPKNYPADKQVVVDVRVRDGKGDCYLVEMQVVAPPSMKGRMVFHWAKIMSNMLQAGEDYAQLPRVISIWIFATRLFQESRKAHLQFELRCQDHRFSLTDYPIIHALQLKNHREVPKLKAESQPSDKHTWMSFFSKADKIKIGQLAEAFEAPIFEEVAEIMHTFTDKGHNAELYHMRMRGLADKRTWENAIETAVMRADEEARARVLEKQRADEEARARVLEKQRADEEARARVLEKQRADEFLELLRQNGINPSRGS